MPTSRNPRAEAEGLLPVGHTARVLEPSPPADTDPAWFADDPTDRGMADDIVVSPVSDGDVAWKTLAMQDGEIEAFANMHWLGPRPALQEIPATYEETRRGLHQIAYFALAPKRFRSTGKLGLRYTSGGFGTPFFGADQQARIEETYLVIQSEGGAHVELVSSVNAAVSALGIGYEEAWFEDFHDPLVAEDPARTWEIDANAAARLADWFGFSTAVLEELRRTPGATDVGRVQLWPEHFDPAVEMGSGQDGRRASYGSSPGDAGHPEPYMYVAPWGEPDTSAEYWNDASFGGASLSYRRLLESDDQFQTALDFYGQGHELLNRDR